MTPFSRLPILGAFLALTLVLASPASAEMRTFTNSQGREIEAEVTGVSGTKVTLKLANGKSYTIPITSLSKPDQLYVKVWKDLDKGGGATKDDDSGKEDTGTAPAPVIPSNVSYSFEIDADKERVKKGSKEETDMGESRLDEWIYQVELENRSRVKLEGLEMSYRIYVDPKASIKMTFDSPPKVYGGRVEVASVADGATVMVKTEEVPLKELELAPGYVFKDGSRNDLEDELEGIWVKIWHGDKKVAEFKSNNSTVKKAKWLDDDPADPEEEEEPKQ